MPLGNRRPLPVVADFFTSPQTPLGCVTCPFLSTCGGYTRARASWSCLDACATCDRATCTTVCLGKPGQFVRDLAEVNGLGTNDIGDLSVTSLVALPRYIPSLQHRSTRLDDTVPSWIAVPLKRVLSLRAFQKIATRSDLCRVLSVPESARLLLLGPAQDKYIERYWENRRPRADFPGLLQVVRHFDAAIAPNFSFFLSDPRPQHLFNRKRALLNAQEWARLGVPPIVYLHTITAHDWVFWEQFLCEHTEVGLLAKEFQTGLARRHFGLEAIENASRLQDRIGRPLHFVAIGGAQYTPDIAVRFDAWTVVDSTPFMKAVHRRAFVAGAGRRAYWRSGKGRSVPLLLSQNIAGYNEWISSHVASAPVKAYARTGT
jgi:hypothetical protein